MPGYPGNNLAKLLYENRQAIFFYEEPATAGLLSTAYQLRRTRGLFYPHGFSVEVAFSADPGAFEVDLMTSDTDVADYYNPSNYPAAPTSISAVNGAFVGRVELNAPFWAKYVALSIKSIANAVNITAMGTY